MSTTTKIFIDTMILKYTRDIHVRYVIEQKNINWGGKNFTANIHVPITVYPNEKINNDKLKIEVNLLKSIAEMVLKGQIELQMQAEVLHEFWGLGNNDPGRNIFSDTDKQTDLFYGAPITMVDAPIKYSRCIAGVLMFPFSPKDYMVDFLSSLSDKRFKQLQKACGAYQGNKPPVKNQLIDAFHVWCAEAANADYFLTCDFKLIGFVKGHKKYPPKVKIVTPSILLKEIALNKEKTNA